MQFVKGISFLPSGTLRLRNPIHFIDEVDCVSSSRL
jgi:hypothetical protein